MTRAEPEESVVAPTHPGREVEGEHHLPGEARGEALVEGEYAQHGLASDRVQVAVGERADVRLAAHGLLAPAPEVLAEHVSFALW